MAVKYRLVKRKVSDLKGGEKVEKSFASTVYNSNVSLEKVCNLVAMCFNVQCRCQEYPRLSQRYLAD